MSDKHVKKILMYNGSVLEINDNSFITDKAVIDVDGNIYNSVNIGTQEWLVQNLKTTKYKDGTPIPNIDASSDWILDVSGAYCWYDNCIGYKNDYGALYNWFAVDNSHGLAPEGWRVPSGADVSVLYKYINNNPQLYFSTGGDLLKEVSTYHWYFSAETESFDTYGFKALPGGMREYVPSSAGFLFMDLTGYAYFFMSDGYDVSTKYFSFIYSSSTFIVGWEFPKNHGASVRCLRDVS